MTVVFKTTQGTLLPAVVAVDLVKVVALHTRQIYQNLFLKNVLKAVNTALQRISVGHRQQHNQFLLQVNYHPTQNFNPSTNKEQEDLYQKSKSSSIAALEIKMRLYVIRIFIHYDKSSVCQSGFSFVDYCIKISTSTSKQQNT